MTSDLILKPCCSSCGAISDLYGSNCRHMTLCQACGKRMAESGAPCPDCGVPVTRLIREYNVKAPSLNKQYFVGRYLQGLPLFSKKNSDTKWSMQREGLQGRQLTDALREKYKGKPWLLEDDQGQQQFQGMLEGGQQATYYLLMMHGKDFLAMPAGAWYNFHKVAQYKQLTLEEAEEQMKNRRKTADGYQRWMMKAASTGAAAFGEVEKISGGGSGGHGSFRKRGDEEDDPALSDKGEEDQDDEEDRKNRLVMNKKTGGDEDGEEPARGDDVDFEDDEPEKGDDWEHEETFTDDDEAVGNDPEEREDQAPELPAPPEMKQEEDEEEGEEGRQEEKGGLSESGLELKKLLGKSAGLDESDDDSEEEDEDVDLDNEDISSPVLAPKRRDAPKEEPIDTTPVKTASAVGGRMAPASVAAPKGKRKAGADEPKANTSPAAKKIKAEVVQEDLKSPVAGKKEPVTSSSPAKAGGPAQVKAMQQANGPVTEEEVKAVLKQMGPAKSTDLVNKFKSRLMTSEDKAAFAAVVKKISRIHKTSTGNFIVLRDK